MLVLMDSKFVLSLRVNEIEQVAHPQRKIQSTSGIARNKENKNQETFKQLIIYMKIFLHSDWLRAVQFFFLNSAKKS